MLGKGSSYFFQLEKMHRLDQGAYVTDEEVERVVNYTISQQKAQYDDRFSIDSPSATTLHTDGDEEYENPLYEEIVEFVVRNGKASASLLQRKFKLDIIEQQELLTY